MSIIALGDVGQSAVLVGVTTVCSTLGALLIQRISLRKEQEAAFDQKRLDAIVDVRQKIEISLGTWRGWAHATITRPEFEDPKERYERASRSIHEAWYATRVFEIYFPDLAPELERLRRGLGTAKDIATRQVDAGRFDHTEFEADSRECDAVLDRVTTHARAQLSI
ncbi:MAG: hypothetical protein RL283_116 [Actinomycetota bacterium]|jgi:hypothetical protein